MTRGLENQWGVALLKTLPGPHATVADYLRGETAQTLAYVGSPHETEKILR